MDRPRRRSRIFYQSEPFPASHGSLSGWNDARRCKRPPRHVGLRRAARSGRQSRSFSPGTLARIVSRKGRIPTRTLFGGCMNIFVETTSLDEIRRTTAAGFADGIVITDAVDSSSAEGRKQIEDIAQEFAIPMCVEVGAIHSDDIYREAREIAKISDHIIIQLPLVDDAVAAMHRLSSEGVGVCANFVFNGAQAVLAAKAGASMVRVALHDLDAQGQTSTDAVTEIRSLLEA